MRLLRSSILLAGLLALPSTGAALPVELAEGLVMFDAAQRSDFNALVEMPLNPGDAGRISAAQSYHRFGLDADARKQADLLRKSNDARVRATAALIDAEVAWRERRLDDAVRLLSPVVDTLVDDDRNRALYILGDALRSQDDLKRSAAVYGTMASGFSVAQGYYNLAASYAKIDADPSRALVALRVAAALAAESKERVSLDLLDKANTLGGYLAIRSKDFDKAITFLAKVRVDAYQSPRAFYLHGLALARQDNYRMAIQSWHRASKFPLVFDGVADAMLGMAVANDELGFSGEAGMSYLESSTAFERESLNTKDLISQVTRQGFYAALLKDHGYQNIEWFLADSIASNTPRAAYLVYLMEDPEIQSGATELEQLRMIKQNLQSWHSDLEVFESMLVKRRQRLGTFSSSQKRSALTDRIERLEARESTLQARLKTVTANGDFLELTDPVLTSRYERLQVLEKRQAVLRQRGATTDTLVQVNARIERIQGRLMWDATEQFARSVLEATASLASIQSALAAARVSLDTLDTKLVSVPVRFDDLIARTRQSKQRIALQATQADTLLSSLDKQVTERALSLLESKRKQMETYRETSLQALAHLYEEMAVAAALPPKAVETGGKP